MYLYMFIYVYINSEVYVSQHLFRLLSSINHRYKCPVLFLNTPGYKWSPQWGHGSDGSPTLGGCTPELMLQYPVYSVEYTATKHMNFTCCQVLIANNIDLLNSLYCGEKHLLAEMYICRVSLFMDYLSFSFIYFSWYSFNDGALALILIKNVVDIFIHLLVIM